MRAIEGQGRLARWLRGESPEAVMAGLIFLLDVPAVAWTAGFSWRAAGASAAACLGAGLSGWRPQLSVGLTALGLALMLLLPSDQVGLAMAASVVPVLALVSRRRWRLAALAALLFNLPIAAYTFTGGPGGLQGSVVSMLGWLVLFAIAGALGAALGYARRLGVIEVQQMVEAQRRQIAIDLHDNVSHDLSMIVMRIEQARLRGEVQPSDLDAISESARRSSRYLRQMMNLLRVGDEHDTVMMDLQETLTSSVQSLRLAGIDVVMQAEPVPEETPVPVADALAKVLKEATNNVLRHGDPRQPCSILFVPTEDSLDLVVSNGLKGTGKRGAGLGLTGMQERLEGVGGRVEIRESPRLWVVRASAPLR